MSSAPDVPSQQVNDYRDPIEDVNDSYEQLQDVGAPGRGLRPGDGGWRGRHHDGGPSLLQSDWPGVERADELDAGEALLATDGSSWIITAVATRAQIEDFAGQIDRGYGAYFW